MLIFMYHVFTLKTAQNAEYMYLSNVSINKLILKCRCLPDYKLVPFEIHYTPTPIPTQPGPILAW